MNIRRRSSAGFTLVELVIVIVVMGILAGAGTVAYGGYVKKSQDANDYQLLAALNEAYIATCLEKSEDPKNVSGSYGFINTDGTVEQVISRLDTDGSSFMRYFENNHEDGPQVFKRHFSLDYKEGEGIFELGETKRVFAADLGIIIDEALNNIFKDSVFYDSDDPDSVKDLMGAMNAISYTMQEMSGGALIRDFANDSNLKDYLINVCGYSEEEVKDIIGEKSTQKTKDVLGCETTETSYFDADRSVITSAAVLHAADILSQKSAAEVSNTIKKASVSSLTSANTFNGIADAATVYAGMVAFANSSYSDGFTATLKSVKIDPTKKTGSTVKEWGTTYTCYSSLDEYLSSGVQIGGSNLSELYYELYSNQSYKSYMNAQDGLVQDMEGFVTGMKLLSDSKNVLADDSGKLDLSQLKITKGNVSTGYGKYTDTINGIITYFD